MHGEITIDIKNCQPGELKGEKKRINFMKPDYFPELEDDLED